MHPSGQFLQVQLVASLSIMVLTSWICPKQFQPISEKRDWYCCGILRVLNSYWVDEASTCIFFWSYPQKSILSSSQKKSWIAGAVHSNIDYSSPVSSLLQHESQLMGEMLSWVFSWVGGTNGEVSAGDHGFGRSEPMHTSTWLGQEHTGNSVCQSHSKHWNLKILILDDIRNWHLGL